MFKLLAVCKFLAAPVAAPLALTLVIAFAGPGGVLEPRDEAKEQGTPEATPAAGGPSAEAAVSSAALVDGAAAGEAVTESDVDQVGGDLASGGAPGGDAVEEPGCVEALTEHAESRPTLEEHMADPDKPGGGVEGNENALDKQCGGAFAAGDESTPADGTTVPPQDGSAGGNGNANGEGNGNANGHDKPDEKTKNE